MPPDTPSTGRTAGTCPMNHGDFAAPDEPGERFGDRQVDTGTLALLVGAAFDACEGCLQARLDAVSQDPVVVTYLVERAAVAVQGAAGGLPLTMYTQEARGRFPAEFRAIVRAGVDRGEDHREMLAVAEDLDDAGRRAAASAALDLVLGYLVMSGG